MPSACLGNLCILKYLKPLRHKAHKHSAGGCDRRAAIRAQALTALHQEPCQEALFAGIDFGTSGARVVVIDGKANLSVCPHGGAVVDGELNFIFPMAWLPLQAVELHRLTYVLDTPLAGRRRRHGRGRYGKARHVCVTLSQRCCTAKRQPVRL